jgi:uncharacterized protein YhjY with autotransporter beta-barrel domain
MELAAHWHRCQNLPKKRVTTSLLYKAKGFMHCSFSFHTVGATWSAKHLSFKHTPFGVQKQGVDAFPRHVDAILRQIQM